MLTDAPWAMLEPLVEQCRPKGRTPPQDQRRMFEAILWHHANGAKWRAVPAELAPWWRTAQTFIRWVRLGVWERLLNLLQERGIQFGMSFLDGTSVRASQKAAGARRNGALKLNKTIVKHLAGLVAFTDGFEASPAMSLEEVPHLSQCIALLCCCHSTAQRNPVLKRMAGALQRYTLLPRHDAPATGQLALRPDRSEPLGHAPHLCVGLGRNMRLHEVGDHPSNPACNIRDALVDQVPHECRTGNPVGVRGGELDRLGQLAGIIMRTRIVEHADAMAGIGRDVEHADALTGIGLAAMILGDLRRQWHLAGRQGHRAPGVWLGRRLPSRCRRPLPTRLPIGRWP